ncbi:MAG: S8 family peptidase [Planctomycetota bacterium]|jgi:subtilisin family serine protease
MARRNLGPLMRAYLKASKQADTEVRALRQADTEVMALHLASRFDGEVTSRGTVRIPAFLQYKPLAIEAGERWKHYRERVEERLAPVCAMMKDVMDAAPVALLAANAIRTQLLPDQVEHIAEHFADVSLLELDPMVDATLMDDALGDIGLPGYQGHHPGGDGSGVTVAVLDSGIDTEHDFLDVADSASTCGEGVELPGSHGTHCAGSVASTDTVFPGVAPAVRLLNIKVLRQDGTGQHTFVTQGIDEALDREADVLSLSLGFNHLPAWSQGGHGWTCPRGRCPLCTAVDNAVALEDVVIVVAAGNEHQRAEALRQWGYGNTFDTELGCPGQAREAFTVGAITKRTHIPAGFTSRGPTSYGREKPTLVAPGVNITSTVPMPRDAQGTLVPDPPRTSLFGRKSGTSMATPIVAGAAALLIQQLRDAEEEVTSQAVRQRLVEQAVTALPFPVNVTGAGRLDLTGL